MKWWGEKIKHIGKAIFRSSSKTLCFLLISSWFLSQQNSSIQLPPICNSLLGLLAYLPVGARKTSWKEQDSSSGGERSPPTPPFQSKHPSDKPTLTPMCSTLPSRLSLGVPKPSLNLCRPWWWEMHTQRLALGPFLVLKMLKHRCDQSSSAKFWISLSLHSSRSHDSLCWQYRSQISVYHLREGVQATTKQTPCHWCAVTWCRLQ